MTQTKKDRAEKKCQIAIDKMIDLQQDFDLNGSDWAAVERILDQLRSLENRITAIEVKDGREK